MLILTLNPQGLIGILMDFKLLHLVSKLEKLIQDDCCYALSGSALEHKRGQTTKQDCNQVTNHECEQYTELQGQTATLWGVQYRPLECNYSQMTEEECEQYKQQRVNKIIFDLQHKNCYDSGVFAKKIRPIDL